MRCVEVEKFLTISEQGINARTVSQGWGPVSIYFLFGEFKIAPEKLFNSMVLQFHEFWLLMHKKEFRNFSILIFFYIYIFIYF